MIEPNFKRELSNARLDKRDRTDLKRGRKLAHEAHNAQAFKVYRQSVLDGTRTPKKVKSHPLFDYFGNLTNGR